MTLVRRAMLCITLTLGICAIPAFSEPLQIGVLFDRIDTGGGQSFLSFTYETRTAFLSNNNPQLSNTGVLPGPVALTLLHQDGTTETLTDDLPPGDLISDGVLGIEQVTGTDITGNPIVSAVFTGQVSPISADLGVSEPFGPDILQLNSGQFVRITQPSFQVSVVPEPGHSFLEGVESAIVTIDVVAIPEPVWIGPAGLGFLALIVTRRKTKLV